MPTECICTANISRLSAHTIAASLGTLEAERNVVILDAGENPGTKELAELGVLGENVVKEYGERLIKNINAFIQQEKLQKYLEHRKSKRTKSAKGSGKENSQNEYADTAGVDPFDVGIDFSTIELPSDNTRKGSKAKSAYWK